MVRSRSMWSYMALVLCLSLVLAGIPVRPAWADSDPLQELVDRLGPVYEHLDDEGKADIQAAKGEISGLGDGVIADILKNNDLITGTVISRLGAADEGSAASMLAPMVKEAAAIQYSTDAGELKNRLQAFRNKWGPTVSKLLGGGITLDDAWGFVGETEKALPGALSNRLGNLALFIGSNNYDAVLAEFSNILRVAATSFDSSFRDSLEGLGWSVTKLVDVKDALRNEAAHGKKAEQALLKGYIRSVTVPQESTSMYAGSTRAYNLKVQVPGGNTTFNIPGSVLKWKSLHTIVADFDNNSNILRAKAGGTATVRAFHPKNMADNAWLAGFDITVKPPLQSGNPVKFSDCIPVDQPLPEPVTLTFGSGDIHLTLPEGITIPGSAQITVNEPAGEQLGQYESSVPGDMGMAGQVVDIAISGWTPAPGEKLTIALKITGGKTKVAIFYYNPATGKWEYQESRVVGDTVMADIPHTSIYAVLEDVTPPANVTLSAGEVTSSSVVLNFAATDSSGIKGYDIYHNGTKIKSLLVGSSYTDTGLSASTTYTYKVTAYDNLGNTADSSTISVTTKSSAGGGGGSGGGGAPAGEIKVVSLLPADGAVEVALDALVSATFDKDVEAKDLAGVTIKDAAGNAVTGVSASLEGRVLKVAHADFAYDTRYTVTIPAQAVKDKNGSAYNKDITWSFTTLKEKPVELPFTDLDRTHWAWSDIAAMYGRGLIAGYPGNTFRPENSITRAEFTALLVRCLGITGTPGAGKNFIDVETGDWFYGVVAAAARNGLVAGYEDGSFRPNNPITRQEMAAMMGRALSLTGQPVDVSGRVDAILSRFADAGSIDVWARESVAVVVEAGLMVGRAADGFAPQASTTRAETVVILKRLLDRF